MAQAAGRSERAPTSTAGIVVWRRCETRRPDSRIPDGRIPDGRISDGRIAGGLEPANGPSDIEIFLVHPGGPFWATKDEHAWSIPKGEFDPASETARDAAFREFVEELDQPVPSGEVVALEPFRAGKKHLHAFAIEGEIDAEVIQPGDEHRSMVELEWPPRSGRTQRFPEVDRAAWVALDEAAGKLHKGQGRLVDHLRATLQGR